MTKSLNLADPILLQRLEGLAAFALGAIAYGWLGQGWLLFAVLFLAPDLAMLGYLGSPKLGQTLYNLVHSYAAPAMLALTALLLGPPMLGLAAIWVAHIGFDRLLGYGLKTGTDFKSTHLGRMGRTAR